MTSNHYSVGGLSVPSSFAEWCRQLPPNARKRLSIHELHHIWEFSEGDEWKREFGETWFSAAYHRKRVDELLIRTETLNTEIERLREAISAADCSSWCNSQIGTDDYPLGNPDDCDCWKRRALGDDE